MSSQTSTRKLGNPAYAWTQSGAGFATQVISLFGTMVWGYCIAYVAASLGVETTDLALASSIYGVLYAGLSVVWGWLADKIGLRYTFTISMLGIGVFLFCFSFIATSVVGAIAAYALCGVFAGGLGSAVLPKLIATWFNANTRSRGMMVAGWGGQFASLTAGLIFPQLILYFEWQGCFRVLGVVCIVIAVLIFVLVADSPYKKGTYPFGMTPEEGERYMERMENNEHVVETTAKKEKPSMATVLKSPITWKLGIVMCLFQFYMMSTTSFRTAAVVSEGYGIVEAGLFGTILSVGMAVGGLIVGVLADRFPRKFVLAVAMVGAGIVYALLDVVLAGGDIVTLYVYGAISGLFYGFSQLLYNLLAECFPLNLRGSGPGMVSSIALVGRFFGPIIAAQVIVIAGGQTSAFAYFAGASLLVGGILALLWIPKTGGKYGDPMAQKSAESSAAN